MHLLQSHHLIRLHQFIYCYNLHAFGQCPLFSSTPLEFEVPSDAYGLTTPRPASPPFHSSFYARPIPLKSPQTRISKGQRQQRGHSTAPSFHSLGCFWFYAVSQWLTWRGVSSSLEWSCWRSGLRTDAAIDVFAQQALEESGYCRWGPHLYWLAPPLGCQRYRCGYSFPNYLI